MKRRLLIFTILLTIVMSFLASRGRQQRMTTPPEPPPAATAPQASPSPQEATQNPASSFEDSSETVPKPVSLPPSEGSLNVASGNASPVMPVSAIPSAPARETPPPQDTTATAGIRRLVVEFVDIPCPGHIRTIIDAMAHVNGVSDVTVFYDESRGEMDYDPSLASPEAIIQGMPPDCPARVVEDKPRT